MSGENALRGARDPIADDLQYTSDVDLDDMTCVLLGFSILLRVRYSLPSAEYRTNKTTTHAPQCPHVHDVITYVCYQPFSPTPAVSSTTTLFLSYSCSTEYSGEYYCQYAILLIQSIDRHFTPDAHTNKVST